MLGLINRGGIRTFDREEANHTVAGRYHGLFDLASLIALILWRNAKFLSRAILC